MNKMDPTLKIFVHDIHSVLATYSGNMSVRVMSSLIISRSDSHSLNTSKF